MGSINGLFYGGGLAQFGVQAVGTISVAAWAFVTMGILFYIMKRTIGIRVSPKEELEGLDISEHFTTSYPEFGPAASDIIPQVGD